MRHPITRTDELIRGGQGHTPADVRGSADVITWLLGAMLIAIAALCIYDMVQP